MASRPSVRSDPRQPTSSNIFRGGDPADGGRRHEAFASVLLVVFIALLGFTPRAAATTLNLSQDLVALGIAATNMVPNQPSLDAGPLLSSGVAYAVAHGIGRVIANRALITF